MLTAAQSKARRSFELAHGQFVAGAVSNLDLLTSEQSLVAADAAVAASDMAMGPVSDRDLQGAGRRVSRRRCCRSLNSRLGAPTIATREQGAVSAVRPGAY